MSRNTEASQLLRWRMSSHLLLEPSGAIGTTINQMLAVQSQDLAAGRYALAQRAGPNYSREDINSHFNNGVLVRAWTMRGTLHICAAEDFHWLMKATRDRTLAALATQRRNLGITNQDIELAERYIVEHLKLHASANRTELGRRLHEHGVNVDGQRAYHLLMAVVLNGLICLGPIPPASGITAQDFVLAENWIHHPRTVQYPIPELVLRYLLGHAPASARDASWYTGQTLTSIRRAIAELGDRLLVVARDERGEELFATTSQVEQWDAQEHHDVALPLRLLGPFDEYYLSYSDRSRVADDELRAQIGPGSNGMVKAFWLRAGRAENLWNANAAPTDSIGAALHQRYLSFRS
ncbi:winged helix DNA-binding domain-containing protein [Glutamicibacter sp.]|uniref:winged helix DNA-binding domain-containing protein n=1 Tax=Glutamicibacter sp. TaxID=1931995 RepID=UPI0028BE7943|nr:winged helix DNA-binding domain-containing protein [Glutamicibacter sp.]